MFFLYSFSFAASLFALIAWFYVQGNRSLSRTASSIFICGFLVYLAALGKADIAFGDKLFILFRDLVVLGVTIQFFSFFRKNKPVFFFLLLLAYGGFQFYYKGVMRATFYPDEHGRELSEQGELLLEVRDPGSLSALQDAVDAYGLTLKPAFTMADTDFTDLDNYYTVDVPKDQLYRLASIKTALRTSQVVDVLEENETLKVSPQPADHSEAKLPQLQLDDAALEHLWGFKSMQVAELLDYMEQRNYRPERKVRIAILDTGVDAKHEDLATNYVSTRNTYDDDPVGHGTHCAGIAAAVSNNGIGVASLSRDNRYVEVTSVKVLNRFGFGTQRDIIQGMLTAADNGADVISMSLGGPSNDKKQSAYRSAVAYANRKGAIVVVAAGNESTNARNIAPANVRGVITVTAVDEQLQRASFSNHIEQLEWGVAAPGVGIYSTIPGDKYASFNGTSMATPYVAGLVGLLRAHRPELTTKQVYELLSTTGIETQATDQTGKFIQPAAALRAAVQAQ